MHGGKTRSTVLDGIEEIHGCLYALVQNQGVGTAKISINDAGTDLLLEPNKNIVLYQGIVPTDIKLTIKSESSQSEIILITTEIIC